MDHSSAAQPLPPPWPAILALRPMPPIPPQGHSLFLWGDRRVHGVALRTAARALTRGLQVAVVDTAMTFHVTPIVAMAQVCRIAPDIFLGRVHIVRAFTCSQLTTLLCDHLHLAQGGAREVGWASRMAVPVQASLELVGFPLFRALPDTHA
jgi:hypothetical protein